MDISRHYGVIRKIENLHFIRMGDVMNRFAVIRAVALVFALIVLAGCAKQAVHVDSLGQAHRDERYIIQPGQAEVRPDDLNFLEYKGQVANLLQSLGYQVTEDERLATAEVRLSYGVQEAIIYSGSDSDTRVGIGMGTGGGYYRDDWGRGWSPGGSFFGIGLGFPLGGGSEPKSSWRYMIVLDAVALPPKAAPTKAKAKAAAPPVEPAEVKSLWKTTIVGTGDDGNLRGVFPVMLNAAREYIGKDSGGPIKVEVKDDE